MIALPAGPLLVLIAIVGIVLEWPGTWWAISFGLVGAGVLILCEMKE